MRTLDKVIGALMWASIAAAVPVVVGVLTNDVYKADWRYTLALCLLWLPPVLSLGQVEDTPRRQPVLFYLFATVAFIWITGLVAYGFFFYEGIP